MKSLALAALMTMALGAAAHAQTTNQTSASGSAATATVLQQNVIPGAGNGTGGGGTANINTTGTTWLLGGTPSMNAVQYDACTKYISASAILAGVNIPLEIDACWKMRQADAIAKYPPGSVQYNLLCADSGILKNDWDTGTMKCTANQAKLAKANPNDPRAVPYQGVPVVAVSGPGINPLPAPAPPGGAAIAASNSNPNVMPSPAGPPPRCSATVRDRCVSG